MIERGLLENPRVDRVIAGHMAPDLPVGTVGKFRSGDVSNVIPETAHLEGSIRALTAEVRQKLIDRLHEVAAGLGKTFNVNSRFILHEGVPPLENDIEVAEFLYEVSRDVLGEENVSYRPPAMGSEDFSYFTEERPSAIMRLGCSNSETGLKRSLHSPYFDIDEQVLEVGVAIFTEAVTRYLS